MLGLWLPECARSPRGGPLPCPTSRTPEHQRSGTPLARAPSCLLGSGHRCWVTRLGREQEGRGSQAGGD